MQMNTFIITLSHNQDSVNSANQTIESANKVGYNAPIEKFHAVLPNGWKHILPYKNTFDDYPRPDNVGACFASHYLLWETCIDLGEPILILEHDAIFVDNIPDIDFKMCVNFGRPSYIRPKHMVYEEPKDGLQPLQQVNFFGHHAYAIQPEAAEIFCQDVRERVLTPNDLWMDKKTYPWLEEYRPYPIIADNDFSTVQYPVPNDSPIVEEYAYGIVPDSPEHKYIMKYYSQCLTAPQSHRYIEV